MILVLGSARSGSTLLKRLFHSFYGINIIEKEIALNEVSNESNIVAKIKKEYVMSRCATYKNYKNIPIKEKKFLQNNKIICIIRNGKNATEKKLLLPEAWVQSIEEYRKYKQYVDLLIYYDDLIKNPDKEQERIMETFNLKPKCKFSEYPSFVPKNVMELEDFREERYKLRPIEEEQCIPERWKKIVPNICRKRFLKFCKMVDNREL